MLRFTITLCSRIWKKDHPLISGSTPIIGGTLTCSMPSLTPKRSANLWYASAWLWMISKALSRELSKNLVLIAVLIRGLLME